MKRTIEMIPAKQDNCSVCQKYGSVETKTGKCLLCVKAEHYEKRKFKGGKQ